MALASLQDVVEDTGTLLVHLNGDDAWAVKPAKDGATFGIALTAEEAAQIITTLQPLAVGTRMTEQ